MQIIDRYKARSRGLKRFYTGKKCKNGHLSERYVSTGACIECTKNTNSDYQQMIGSDACTVSVRCHKDDEQLIRIIIDRLNMARNNANHRTLTVPLNIYKPIVCPRPGWGEELSKDAKLSGLIHVVYNYLTGEEHPIRDEWEDMHINEFYLTMPQGHSVAVLRRTQLPQGYRELLDHEMMDPNSDYGWHAESGLWQSMLAYVGASGALIADLKKGLSPGTILVTSRPKP